ncbi:putative phage abortive infection protein [Marivirga sericea]|nr:putative phage abortive infection protein [Marivirga sericea]
MKKYSIRAFWAFITLAILLLILYYSALQIFNDPDGVEKFQLGEKGALGAYLNGFLAPLIGLAAVMTTFLAFLVQYQSNKQIRNDTEIERFENKYYQMLNLHKENVNEIEIAGKHKGRKAFVKMFEEIRFIYSELKKIDKKYKLLDRIRDKQKRKHEKLIKIAYHHMFFGIDFEGKKCNNEMEGQYLEISKILCKRLTKYQKKFLRCNRRRLTENYSYKHKGLNKKTFEPDFYPFDGYVSKLGHLYRNLFHMIKYVARTDFLSWQQKYDYLKMLRGQLSNHEQVIMYFNIIWIDKETWWLDNIDDKPQSYLLDYAILKNLPFNLTNQLGPDPIKFYEDKMKTYYRFKGKDLKTEDFKKSNLNDMFAWLFEWN